jgi:hypothetical protein
MMDLQIAKSSAKEFAGFIEEARQYGQNWVTYEVFDSTIKQGSWQAFRGFEVDWEDKEIIRPFARLAAASDLLPKLYEIIDQPEEAMHQSVNFYELKTQLADLGFSEPELVDQLREALYAGEEQPWLVTELEDITFQFYLEKDLTGSLNLTSYDAILESGWGDYDQAFEPTVPAREAIMLLSERANHPHVGLTISRTPMNRVQVRQDLGLTGDDNWRYIDIVNALVQIRALGLDENDLGKQLAQLPEKDTWRKELWLVKQSIPIKLLIEPDEWQELSFKGYEIWPRIIQTEFEHYKENDIDTRELDTRMSTIDWQRFPGLDSVEKEKMKQVFTDLKKLTAGYDGRNEEYQWLIKWATDGLSRKHFAGTPAEKYIIGDDGSGRFIFRQRYAFPPNVPINFLLKQIDNPDELNKMSYDHQYLAHKLENTMNTQNLSYLQKQLLNLGFGEGMNKDLEKQIEAKAPEFTLDATNVYNKQYVDYKLHFKAGDKDEMYFFNKYDAKLNDTQQTFYINKGSGITAKEAYNLMAGRAVHKELENKEGEKYKAWVTLDKENKTENGNFKLNTFSEGWNYKPERAIDKMDIVGINEEGARDKLLRSLEKGNRHQVDAIREGKTVKVFLEANPAEHRVNITNYKGEPQKLEHYKKPEQKPAQAQEDAPAKKQRKGTKMHV